MTQDDIIKKLKSLSRPEELKAMERFGINPGKAFGGIRIPDLKKIALEIGKNHETAQKLWKTGIHEARLLAVLIEDPKKVTEKQMDIWVKDFDTWDICDTCCMHLFRKTKFAYSKINQWSSNRKEFIKRAAFTLIASLAVHEKNALDETFSSFFDIIILYSNDERNYVKKAVNWALRSIGKKNIILNKLAIKTAYEIKKTGSKSAVWIANDAIRELESEKIQKRFKKKEKK